MKIVAGVTAGAAGTCALNLVTYLDMSLRGRPASEMPAQVAGVLATKAGLRLGAGDAGDNRRTALGALLGYATGLGVGAAYSTAIRGRRPPIAAAGLGLAVAAMIASDAPMTAHGLTDPRTWKPADWLTDAIAHLAYGLVTAGAYRALTRAVPDRRARRSAGIRSALRPKQLRGQLQRRLSTANHG